MTEVRENHLRSIMDSLVAQADQVHKLMCDMAEVCGYYRKRVRDLTVGDEIGYHDNEWKLVANIEETATPEGFGVTLVTFDDDHSWPFDPMDIVDVRAAVTQDAF